MNKIDEAKKQLRSALLSGDWNQAIAHVKVALALLESGKAEQVNWDRCQYCGASRVVRPSGEWQFTCHCDDPEKRPKAEQHFVGCHDGFEFLPEAEQPAVAELQCGEPVETREFIKRVYIWADQVMDDPKYPAKKLATEASKFLGKACKLLDAQQKQIERLKAEQEKFKHDNGVRIQILNNTRERNRNLQHEVTLLNTKIDRLTAENKAKAERIAKLERFIRESEGHTKDCGRNREGFEGCDESMFNCNCGYEKAKDQALKGEKP
jgi:uncharacterized small protein (DUF1192 family)